MAWRWIYYNMFHGVYLKGEMRGTPPMNYEILLYRQLVAKGLTP